MSSKRIEQNIPITAIDRSRASHPNECIDNPTHLKLSLHYSTGGINYFTYKNERRGVYVSIRIEKVRDEGSYTARSFDLFGKMTFRVEDLSFRNPLMDKEVHDVSVEKIPEIVIPEGIENTPQEIDREGTFNIRNLF